MDNNATAKRLADLGRSDKRILSKIEVLSSRLTENVAALEHNRAERCALLTEVAQSPAAGLDADTVPTVIEPKED